MMRDKLLRCFIAMRMIFDNLFEQFIIMQTICDK